MMAEEDDAAEKEHEPTQKRLDDARKKGEVPQSPDLITAASYGGFVLACVTSGGDALRTVGLAGATMLDQSDRLGTLMRESGAAPLIGVLTTIGGALGPFFALPAGAALAAILAQQALTFTPEKLGPRLSRISLFAALGHKFGREGLFEFAKSTVKLCIISVILGFFLMSRMDQVVHALTLTPALATVVMLRLSVAFLCLVLLVAIVIGGVDFLWQKAQFLHRNRMSRQEIIDEFKQSEGDPYMKAQRRQRGQEIAANRMLLDVPRADVIIANPTHYAVALIWNRTEGAAPVCVAKGVDGVAARIREHAAAAGVPIHRDAPTARALFAAVEIGQEIRPEHYRAVAAAIRFAEAMRLRARGRA